MCSASFGVERELDVEYDEVCRCANTVGYRSGCESEDNLPVSIKYDGDDQMACLCAHPSGSRVCCMCDGFLNYQVSETMDV